MKKIKKLFVITIALLASVTLVGCGAKEKNLEGSLEELMTKVYQNIPEDKLPMMLSNTKVTEENVEYYLGTKDIEFKEALASEPMVGSIAHSVVLVRTKDNANVEEVKKKIKDNVDPRKWICVGVEENDVIVENKGNLIILIMSSELKEDIQKGFENLK